MCMALSSTRFCSRRSRDHNCYRIKFHIIYSRCQLQSERACDGFCEWPSSEPGGSGFEGDHGNTLCYRHCHTTCNLWKYLEGFMDVTAVSSSFTLQLVANNTIQIDDFVAMPKQARVTYSSYLPLTGVTGQTDDRGNSSKTDFDTFGRPVKGYDRQR